MRNHPQFAKNQESVTRIVQPKRGCLNRRVPRNLLLFLLVSVYSHQEASLPKKVSPHLEVPQTPGGSIFPRRRRTPQSVKKKNPMRRCADRCAERGARGQAVVGPDPAEPFPGAGDACGQLQVSKPLGLLDVCLATLGFFPFAKSVCLATWVMIEVGYKLQ